MKIVRSLDLPITDQPVALTMGKFDGLHLGHRQLIQKTIDQAKAKGYLSTALTWEPHPNVVLRPDQPLELLTSLDEKIALMATTGLDMLVIAPFTQETKATSADAYLGQICASLPLRELWVGEDFAMGRGRAGNVAHLEQIGADLGFSVHTLPQVDYAGKPVNASRIRQLLQQGQVEAAAELLERPFSVQGVVVEGDKRGRTIGFPTANVAVDEQHVVPANGVYACQVYVGGEAHPTVTNVGVRPTFGGLRRTVEAHLLDWSGDLYGQTIQVAFLHRLRDEQKFSGIDALIAQIRKDADAARELLG